MPDKIFRSALVSRLLLFPDDIATMGVEVHPVLFNTNRGPILFNVWDCTFSFMVVYTLLIIVGAGQEKFAGLRDGYLYDALQSVVFPHVSSIGSQCAIIMFDYTCRLSFKSIPNWYRDVYRVCERIPISFAGSKVSNTQQFVGPHVPVRCERP